MNLQEGEVSRVLEYIRSRSSALLVIAFVDMVRSTALADRYGDSVADCIRDAFERVVAQEVKKSGLLVKFLGDGALCVFVEPTAAIQTGLDLQDRIKESFQERPDLPQPAVRIGMHLGQVTVRDRVQLDFLGSHVNKAARIEGYGPIGGVAISYTLFDSVYPRLKENQELVWRSLGEKSLKGFDHPVRIIQLFRGSDPSSSAGGSPVVKPESLLQSTVAGHRLTKFLGFGGYGSVYLGLHEELGTSSAIKISHWTPNMPGLREAFSRGARAQKALEHPNIARIFDFGEFEVEPPTDWSPIHGRDFEHPDVGLENRLALVMEYVDGPSLESRLGKIAGIGEFRAVLKELKSVFHALDYAHNKSVADSAGFMRKGICHGDVKPRNIMYTSEGQPKLIDFMMLDYQRLASRDPEDPEAIRLSLGEVTTAAFGTPGFMAPEQEQRGIVSPATDIFALARTLCELLSGTRAEMLPPEATTDLTSGLPGFVGRRPRGVLRKAMDPEPEQRHSTAMDLFRDLDRSTGSWFSRFR